MSGTTFSDQGAATAAACQRRCCSQCQDRPATGLQGRRGRKPVPAPDPRTTQERVILCIAPITKRTIGRETARPAKLASIPRDRFGHHLLYRGQPYRPAPCHRPRHPCGIRRASCGRRQRSRAPIGLQYQLSLRTPSDKASRGDNAAGKAIRAIERAIGWIPKGRQACHLCPIPFGQAPAALTSKMRLQNVCPSAVLDAQPGIAVQSR